MTRSLCALLCVPLFVILPLAVCAQERIDLTTVEQPPSNSAYRLERLVLDIVNPTDMRISIYLRGVNNEQKICTYDNSTTPTGETLLIGLNKANLSLAYANTATTGTLKQRIFHRLAVMGEGKQVCAPSLGPGTVAGTVP